MEQRISSDKITSSPAKERNVKALIFWEKQGIFRKKLAHFP
jgi:hypothetical protein